MRPRHKAAEYSGNFGQLYANIPGFNEAAA